MYSSGFILIEIMENELNFLVNIKGLKIMVYNYIRYNFVMDWWEVVI